MPGVLHWKPLVAAVSAEALGYCRQMSQKLFVGIEH